MRKLLVLLTAFLLLAGSLYAQKIVTGKVSDDKGNPIPGVSVQIKGTKSGTVTSSEGTYSLSVPANSTTLVFSAVDFVTLEKEIGTTATIDVSLKNDEQSLTEVVVTGF